MIKPGRYTARVLSSRPRGPNRYDCTIELRGKQLSGTTPLPVETNQSVDVEVLGYMDRSYFFRDQNNKPFAFTPPGFLRSEP